MVVCRFLSPAQDIIDGPVMLMGFDQIIVHHLDIPSGHIQRGVTEQALEMDRVHAGPQRHRGEGSSQRVGGDLDASLLCQPLKYCPEPHRQEPQAITGHKERTIGHV